MKRSALLCGFTMLLGVAGTARAERRTEVVDRMEAAAIVLDEVMAAPDRGVPAEVLAEARCIVIVPGFSKGAFIVGGEGGAGVASCRTPAGWSAPAPIKAGGASIGLQVGGAKSDVVLFLMSERAEADLRAGKLKGGGDISVAAGPVGAHASGVGPRAAVLAYSRSKGLFAGVAYDGVKTGEDEKATVALYGQPVLIGAILDGHTAVPPGVEHLVESIRHHAGAARHAR